MSLKIDFCVQREIFSFQTLPPLLTALWVAKTPQDFRTFFNTCFMLLILWFAFRCLSYVPPWVARKIEVKGQREIGDFIGACSSPVFLLGAVPFPQRQLC